MCAGSSGILETHTYQEQHAWMGHISRNATSASRNSFSFALWLDEVMSQGAETKCNDCHDDGRRQLARDLVGTRGCYFPETEKKKLQYLKTQFAQAFQNQFTSLISSNNGEETYRCYYIRTGGVTH